MLRLGPIRMYSCGPTVYSFAHIGNFRTFLVADLLRRVLERAGYVVRQVMNITDVGHMTDESSAEAVDKMLLAVEDEGRLSDFTIRDHFLTRVFASARLRAVKTMRDLVRFQATHKLLLLGHGQVGMRSLGRVVANAEHRPWGEVRALYAAGVAEVLSRPARRPAMINVFQHAFGFVSERLGPREKRHFDALLRSYLETRVPVGAVTTLLRSWVERFDVPYLAEQVLFEPYPVELVSLLDSGKGRAV